MGKSKIVPIREVEGREDLAKICCCRIGSLPIIICAFGIFFKVRTAQNPTLEKIELTLAGERNFTWGFMSEKMAHF